MITHISPKQFNNKLVGTLPSNKDKMSSVPICNLKLNNVYADFLYPKNYRNISFKGMSQPELYETTSEYFAAIILQNELKSSLKKGKTPAWLNGITSSDLSKANIKKTIDSIFENELIFSSTTLADKNKIKWGRYVKDDIKSGETDRVNLSREHRLEKWKNFLINPIDYAEKNGIKNEKNTDILEQISTDNCIKFIIWKAINHGLNENNRHIPAPFDLEALSNTISWLNSILDENRSHQIGSEVNFLNLYINKLKEKLLRQIKSYPPSRSLPKILEETKDGEYWVKIPKINKNHDNDINMHAVEILSHDNWCTRSGKDKAKAVIEDGSFYVCLRRNKKDSQLLETILGIASYGGKIDQIQGPKNNNLIPLEELDNVKRFIKKYDLKCNYDLLDNGPKAGFEILIAEKLCEKKPPNDMSLQDAITSKNDLKQFKILEYDIENNFFELMKKMVIDYRESFANGETGNIMQRLRESKDFEIKLKQSYIPKINLGRHGEYILPYSFFDIDEDKLLQNVSEIDGSLVLASKRNEIVVSGISKFPPKLRKVSKKIYCNEEQYNKFRKEMLAVVDNDETRIINISK